MTGFEFVRAVFVDIGAVVIGAGAVVFIVGVCVVDSTPFALRIKSSGSTLYFSMRSWLRPASTHSKNEYPASAASVRVYGQYG